MELTKVKLIECPRDAMQGWETFIPAQKKIEYINSLLKVGFDTIDFGSFVSPRIIPQMSDTREVVMNLQVHDSNTKLLAIVANVRGAQEASEFDEIAYLGFPFSVSETFQQRNTNSSIAGSLKRVEEIIEICSRKNKQLVIYISMGFGNPYGDEYSEEIVFKWINKLVSMGIRIISLSDTVGVATPEQVYEMTKYVINAVPSAEVGVHLHSKPDNWKAKLEAAVKAGCKRFDGALKGIGGCPMAEDELIGNMNTEWMISYFEENNFSTGLNKEALSESLKIASEIFV